MTDPRPRALITGASSGLGETFARQLARRGHDFVLVARRKDRLESLAAELSEKHNAASEVIQADLTSEDGIAAVAERLQKGDIELLVNNAGFGTRGEFARLPLEREIEMLDLNVRTLVRLTHVALGPMLERGSGGILNIASTAAFQPVPFMATYAATKAFVLQFSEAVHEEVKPHGVKVTCLCPGPVRTEFQQVAGVNDRQVPSFVWTDQDHVVRSALSALRAGRSLVTPGPFNTASSAIVRFSPRFLTRRVAGSMFRRPAES